MRRFRFSLEVLLQLRRRKEEEIKRRLARKNAEIAAMLQEIRRLHDAFDELQKTQKEKRQAFLDIIDLRYSVAYRHSLKNDMLKASKRIDALRAEADGIRTELMRARQKTRSVELVRERRFMEWKKKLASQEQGRTDEISQQRFVRTTSPVAA